MSDEDNILFLRRNSAEASDDLWDDSVLIKAYDKAINSAKEELSKRMCLESESIGTKPKKTHSQKPQKKWCIGSPCQAVYSEDGELYEAIITNLFEATGSCIVKFIGYNNKEKVALSSLVESEGLQSQIAQKRKAASAQNANLMDYEECHKINGLPENSTNCGISETKPFQNTYNPESSFNPDLNAMPPAPPLPPQLMARLPESETDALSSMLMSWYISGFHTGFYHGLRQAQSNRGQRKK